MPGAGPGVVPFRTGWNPRPGMFGPNQPAGADVRDARGILERKQLMKGNAPAEPAAAGGGRPG